MGGQNSDYLGTLVTPDATWTLAQLHLLRIEVHARCERCGVKLRVNVAAMIRAAGPDLSLWNRRSPCRVLGCDGRVRFWGRDRRNADWVRMTGNRLVKNDADRQVYVRRPS